MGHASYELPDCAGDTTPSAQARAAGAGFWSHMLAPMAYAISILALLLGLSPARPDLTAMEVTGDALSSVTTMSEQLQGLYSANAPVIHLTLAALALLWVLTTTGRR